MPNAQNVATMAQIKEDLVDIKAVWAISYCGLTVKQSQELRRAVRAAGGEMHVFKNSLMHRALSEANMPNMEGILEGPSAFIFAKDDAIGAAKAVKNFAKTNDKVAFKGGVMDGAFLNAEEAMAVASLPSREELLSKLLATMLNPMSKMARAVSEIAKQKEETAA